MSTRFILKGLCYIFIFMPQFVYSAHLTVENGSYGERDISLYLTTRVFCCFLSNSRLDRVVAERSVFDMGKAKEFTLFVRGNRKVYCLGSFVLSDDDKDGHITMEYEDGDCWSTTTVGLDQKNGCC